MRHLTQYMAQQVHDDTQIHISDDPMGREYHVGISTRIDRDNTSSPEAFMDAVLKKVLPESYIRNSEKYKKLVSVMKMLGEEM